MTNFFIAGMFMAIFSIGCTNDTPDLVSEKESYTLTKEELRLKEHKNPPMFIKVTTNHKRNFFGQTVIKGTMINNASVASFKDIELKLYFYSKTKSLLETDRETIFEELTAGERTNFKTKYFAPKGTDSVYIEVLSAKHLD